MSTNSVSVLGTYIHISPQSVSARGSSIYRRFASRRMGRHMERINKRCLRYDVKIVLGENIFRTTARKFSLHSELSPNGLRSMDLAEARNINRKTRNRFEHVVIDGQHTRILHEIKSYSSKDFTRLYAAKSNPHQAKAKFDVEKLQSQ